MGVEGTKTIQSSKVLQQVSLEVMAGMSQVRGNDYVPALLESGLLKSGHLAARSKTRADLYSIKFFVRFYPHDTAKHVGRALAAIVRGQIEKQSQTCSLNQSAP